GVRAGVRSDAGAYAASGGVRDGVLLDRGIRRRVRVGRGGVATGASVAPEEVHGPIVALPAGCGGTRQRRLSTFSSRRSVIAAPTRADSTRNPSCPYGESMTTWSAGPLT